MLRSWRPSRPPALVAALCIVHATLAIALFHEVRFDDAFIIYRYGQNLAEGNGLAFNVGEQVWGSTSVVWVFVSALVHRLVGHDATPNVMASLGCLAWTAQALFIYLILRATGKPLAGALGALAIGIGAAGSFCWVGMETHLALALGLGALWFALSERWRSAAILSALAMLTRPDAIVPAMLVMALAGRRLGVRALRPIAWGAVVLLPWYTYQFLQFQSAVASSMSRKVGLSSFSHYALHVVTIVPAELLSMVTGWSAPLVAIYAAPLVWPLVVVGVIALVKADQRLLVVPAWMLAHIGGYLLWRPLTNQTWHMYPLVTLAVVSVWAGLTSIAETYRDMRLLRRVALPLVATTLFGLALIRTTWFAVEGSENVFWFGGRHRAYVDAASLIRAHASPGDLVAAGEVGTLAYYSGLPVQDWNGLVTADPQALVHSLATGRPGRVRWLAAWAKEDLAYFRASVENRDGLVWHIPGSPRSVYLFDLASSDGAN